MHRTNPVYRTAIWARLSKRCLIRDGRMCMIRLPGCKGVATTADHIIELEDGGPVYELDNLQAACRSCNTAKGNMNRVRRERRRRPSLQRW